MGYVHPHTQLEIPTEFAEWVEGRVCEGCRGAGPAGEVPCAACGGCGWATCSPEDKCVEREKGIDVEEKRD